MLTRHPDIDAIDIEVEVMNNEFPLKGMEPERQIPWALEVALEVALESRMSLGHKSKL